MAWERASFLHIVIIQRLCSEGIEREGFLLESPCQPSWARNSVRWRNHCLELLETSLSSNTCMQQPICLTVSLLNEL